MGGGGNILGPVLGFVGAQQSAKAMKSAASEQAAATREATRLSVESQEKMQQKALDAQEKALREQRGYMSPYRTAGTQGLYQYLYQMGAGAPSASMYKAAFADPTQTARIAELRSKIGSLTPAAQAAGAPPAAAQAAPQGSAYDQFVKDYEARWQGKPSGSALLEFQRSQMNKPQGQAPAQAAPAAAGITPEQQSELAAMQAELATLEQQQTGAHGGEFSPWKLEESPTYKIQMEDTEKAINRGLLARGLYGSRYGVNALSDNARRLAANEQEVQMRRLQGLTSMGQEASAGMAQGGMNAANQMTNMYGQGAQNYMGIYDRQAQGLGDAAYNRGAAQAGMWSNLSDLGGRMWQQSANQQIYGPQRAPLTAPAAPVAQTNYVDKMLYDYNKYGFAGGR